MEKQYYKGRFKMKKLSTLLLAGILGCATTGKSNLRIETYSGEDWEYKIEAKEVFQGERCIERQIILKETNGLHTSLDHVSYVKATDMNCDETFERFYFRNSMDKNVNRNRLTEKLNFLFYTVKY